MRLASSIQKVALEEKLSKMRYFLDVSIRDIGLEPTDYPDVQSLIDFIPSMVKVIEDGDPVRFHGGYRLWGSVPKESYPDHWMYPLCSTTQTYMPIPLDELQGSEGFKSSVMEHTDSDFLRMIEKHFTLFEYEGCAQIIFTQVDSDTGTGFMHKGHMTHPYTAACSLHELFKLLLEWQWAVLHAENTETVGQVACDFLDHLGLHVDDQGSNPVVRDLMSLPDMQVAQYVKTGECSLVETEPEMPVSFRLWALENNLLEAPQPLLAQLYQDCVSYTKVANDLARL